MSNADIAAQKLSTQASSTKIQTSKQNIESPTELKGLAEVNGMSRIVDTGNPSRKKRTIFNTDKLEKISACQVTLKI